VSAAATPAAVFVHPAVAAAGAGPCTSPTPEDSPAFGQFERFVEAEYGDPGRSAWSAGLSTRERAMVYGHALGRVALAVGGDDTRHTVASCLLAAFERRTALAVLHGHLAGDATLRAYMRTLNEAAMGLHDEEVARVTRVRDESPAEDDFVALGLPSSGSSRAPTAAKLRPAPPIPPPAAHPWAGLCHKDIVARENHPVLHLSFPPFGSMDVFDDPETAGCIGVSNCAHHPSIRSRSSATTA
jgi:hypothetical protein